MNYSENYKEVILHFEALDEDHKQPYLFALLGYATYLSQNFEKLLKNILSGHKVVNRNGLTRKKLVSYLDDLESGRYTMGMLKEKIRSTIKLSSEEIEKIEEIKNLRNFLIHKYFVTNNKLLFAPNGYKRIIKDFIGFINKMNSIEDILHEHQLQLFEKLGLSLEKVQALIDADVRQISDTEIEDTYISIPK